MKSRTHIVSKGKRQSPAHRSQKRLLQETEAYLMGNLQYFWKSKWGISDRTKTRRAQVDKSTPGDVFVIMSRQIPFGWQAESWVHTLYFWSNAPFKGKDGGTEWFLNINLIFGALFYWVFKYRGYEILVSETGIDWWWYAVAAWSPWIWVDGLLWLIFFRLFWWAVAIGLMILTYHILIA